MIPVFTCRGKTRGDFSFTPSLTVGNPNKFPVWGQFSLSQWAWRYHRRLLWKRVGTRQTSMHTADMDQQEMRMLACTTIPELERALVEHEIDPSAFGKGKAKTLDHLLKELEQGECELQSHPSAGADPPELVRSLRLVRIQLKYGGPYVFWENN